MSTSRSWNEKKQDDLLQFDISLSGHSYCRNIYQKLTLLKKQTGKDTKTPGYTQPSFWLPNNSLLSIDSSCKDGIITLLFNPAEFNNCYSHKLNNIHTGSLTEYMLNLQKHHPNQHYIVPHKWILGNNLHRWKSNHANQLRFSIT